MRAVVVGMIVVFALLPASVDARKGKRQEQKQEQKQEQPEGTQKPEAPDLEKALIASNFLITSSEFEKLTFRLRHDDDEKSEWLKFGNLNFVKLPVPGKDYFFEVKKDQDVLTLHFRFDGLLVVDEEVKKVWSKFDRLWIGLSTLAFNRNKQMEMLSGWQVGVVSYVNQLVVWLNVTDNMMFVKGQSITGKIAVIPDIVALPRVDISPIRRPVFSPAPPTPQQPEETPRAPNHKQAPSKNGEAHYEARSPDPPGGELLFYPI